MHTVSCPHCGATLRGIDQYFDGPDRDTVQAGCATCRRYFDLTRDISVDYTARKSEEPDYGD